ncbi:MBL fold metallo-hydrolase [Maribellus comscasis]|uniref:MBL fold metallo-hydrolase n=1 Tax=Maribellus comscasis TaxID=2681766 RepID=A0A6I6JMB0_9BACT|nr:MBL fold metallo-hydrolase [Maribellus comscasis]QGY43501.1 MBL fold metallo-hydrolase [Maribellus comscasis]
MKKSTILIIGCLISFTLTAQDTGEPLPVWQEGEMEIHHIFTGGGESVFCIFPDGTTLLIDAGDIGPHIDPRQTKTSPNDSKQPGEWLARYITNRIDFKNNKKIDYAFLTHFHADHMGGVYENSEKTRNGGDYYLSGITEVYEHAPFSKIIDRDWPSYHYPNPNKTNAIDNYKKFLEWNNKNNKLTAENFIPGTNKQFVLVNSPEKYPGFEIRNIVSNGEVWTGKGEKTKQVFPKGEAVSENKRSCGIKISYGDFDYFNGGDLAGHLSFGMEAWKDIETPVGKALGIVEVCEANHHAWIDAMNENFLNSVKPQIIVMQINHITHFNLSTMNRMANKKLNPNLKHIIPTNIPEISRAYIGVDQLKKVTGDGGHVVIKVMPEGKQYFVCLLTTKDESYKIKSILGPYKCNKK